MPTRLRIYLCDLVHDYTKNSDSYFVFPLNIGFISAYCKQELGDEVDITLFKYPGKFEDAIKNSKPDIVGFSFYTWNEELVHHFAKKTKQLHPDILTVFGGPNIDASESGFNKFFNRYPFVDYYIPYEGEEVFTDLVRRYRKEKNIEKLKSSEIQGVARKYKGQVTYNYLDSKTKNKVISYPSPYLTGVLDEFLGDSYLYPLFESNRGCPFKCTFCAWGVSALDKVRMWPIEQVMEEFEYYIQRSVGQDLWIFSDANFGIVKRDVEIAKKIREYKEHPKGPKRVLAWNSKNTTNRNIEIQEIFGDMSGFLVAFQSLDEKVLENIKRKNIKTESLLDLVDYFKEKEADIETDILIGLPGESYESHIETLRKCFDHDIRYIRGLNIRLLGGTDMASDEDVKKFGTKTKFRLIRDSYGKYWDKWIIDTEEVVTSTNALSENEMLRLRVVHFFIWLFWNVGFLQPLLVFGRAVNVNPIDMLTSLADNADKISDEFYALISEYYVDADKEWFDSKEELIGYYQERYESIEDALDSSNNLNFIYSAKIAMNENLFKSILNYLASYIEEKSPRKAADYDINGVKEYTFNRILFDFDGLKGQKEIQMSKRSFDFLLDENIIGADVISSDTHENKIIFPAHVKDYDFIRNQLATCKKSGSIDKIVTSKFLTSLIFEPVYQGRVEKSSERMKVMSGDTIS
jgi:radical SAM superfamily enzyme YgiQ (UPF0313 family)